MAKAQPPATAGGSDLRAPIVRSTNSRHLSTRNAADRGAGCPALARTQSPQASRDNRPNAADEERCHRTSGRTPRIASLTARDFRSLNFVLRPRLRSCCPAAVNENTDLILPARLSRLRLRFAPDARRRTNRKANKRARFPDRKST